MPAICLRPATLRLVTTATFVTVMLTSFNAEAEFHSRLGGQAYYDDLLDITWATDTNHISFGTWGTRLTGMSTLIIGGVPGWRLPDMDVNNDGMVENCGLVSEVDCRDNEMGHVNWFGDGTSGIYSGAPGPFTNMGPFNYWSNTVAPGNDEAYFINMSNGGVSQAWTQNIFGGWAVHDGDVEPTTVAPLPIDGSMVSLLVAPNPFGSRTVLSFLLAHPEMTRVRVFDLAGRLVDTLVDARLEAGLHNLPWDGRDVNGSTVAAGVYLMEARIGQQTVTTRVVRLR
jgi:hypothetical protein